MDWREGHMKFRLVRAESARTRQPGATPQEKSTGKTGALKARNKKRILGLDWRAGRMILFEGLFHPFRAFIFAMQLTQGVALG